MRALRTFELALVAVGQKQHGVGRPRRRFEQAVARHVLAQLVQNRAVRRHQLPPQRWPSDTDDGQIFAPRLHTHSVAASAALGHRLFGALGRADRRRVVRRLALRARRIRAI